VSAVSSYAQSRSWSHVRVAGPVGGGVGVLVCSMLTDLRDRALSRIAATYEVGAITFWGRCCFFAAGPVVVAQQQPP
jgi:hypothetical protein